MQKIHVPLAVLVLCSLIALFDSCTTDSGLPPSGRIVPAQIDYVEDSEPDEFQVIEDDSGARLATGPRGKLTFQVMQEGDIMRNPSNTWKLYFFGDTEPPAGASDRTAYATANKAKYSVSQPANARSYTRKTLPVGWYLIRYNDSDLFYSLNVPENSDQLVNMDDNSGFNSPFTGIFPTYGKIKFSLWYGTQKPEQISLDLINSENKTVSYILYAEDGTGLRKGLFWYVPAKSYRFNARAYELNTLTGTANVNAGKTYPHVKLKF